MNRRLASRRCRLEIIQCSRGDLQQSLLAINVCHFGSRHRTTRDQESAFPFPNPCPSGRNTSREATPLYRTNPLAPHPSRLRIRHDSRDSAGPVPFVLLERRTLSLPPASPISQLTPDNPTHIAPLSFSFITF